MILTKPYYPLLDALRFFAAFWVMNFHYLSVLGLSNSLHWYRYGNLGVQLFFIVSGFVIVESLQSKTIREFAILRFIRLYPLFWILCTVTFIFPYFFPHAATSSVSQYVVSMTMFGDILNEILHTSGLVDPSYWTLTIELLFYIGIGTFVFLFSSTHIRYFLISWLCVSVIAFSLHIDQNFFIKLLLVRHVSYFVFGGALALIASRLNSKSTIENDQNKKILAPTSAKYVDYLLLVGSALYSILIVRKALPPYVTSNIHDAYIVTLIHIAFFISTSLLVYFSKYVTHSRVVRLLFIIGGMTYPLYLLHQKIGNTVLNYVTHAYNISWNLTVFMLEIVIICISFVVYILDSDMRKWLRSILLK